MPTTIKNRWKAGKKKKKVGFMARMKNGKAGRNVLRRRRQKGRSKLAA